MKANAIPHPKFGRGPSPPRVRAVARALGLDLAGFGARAAAVVGSNGKGSTAAMAAALLAQSGGPVGLFTSPHLFDLNERFRIDGADIGEQELALHWRRVAGAVEAAGEAANLGGFEFLFLIAADWFAARGCAFTVWEAGIGGRLDPVRAIEAARLALTSLDLEHTALLGPTLADIARDKLDAAPSGARVFASAFDRTLDDAIRAHCVMRGLRLEVVAAESGLACPLAGDHQRHNLALALRLAQDMTALQRDRLQAGLDAVRWPGRLERLSETPLVVIDVGHTLQAVRCVRAAFETMRQEREAALICGVSRDKDAAGIVASLAPGFAHIVCVAPRHKGAPATDVAALAAHANPGAQISAAQDMAEARRIALARAGAVLVAGGLFLAAEFRAVHFGRDPESLAFF